jgi:hypothetical protein
VIGGRGAQVQVHEYFAVEVQSKVHAPASRRVEPIPFSGLSGRSSDPLCFDGG